LAKNQGFFEKFSQKSVKFWLFLRWTKASVLYWPAAQKSWKIGQKSIIF
jgi:hypothetical protein